MMNHMIWMDGDVVPGSFYSECVWFFPDREPTRRDMDKVSKGGPQPHTFPFEEVLTYFGTNYDDHHDLGGEIELWIDGEQNIINRSFVAFIPAGMVHCPLNILRIDRPIFHFTAGPGKMYE